jgi:hypothetical protein
MIRGGIVYYKSKMKTVEAVLRLQYTLQTGVARQFWKDGGK